jgi:LAS superfamily LD-carboxypeptidase LdcB
MALEKKYVFATFGVLSGIVILYALVRAKKSTDNTITSISSSTNPTAGSAAKGLASLEEGARKKFEQFFALAKKEGYTLILVSARRDCAKQDNLYAQGRTKPGKIITYAKCGESDHNLGLAIDVAPVINGKVNYKVPKGYWEGLAKIANSLGLGWGGRWANLKDVVHFSAGSR